MKFVRLWFLLLLAVLLPIRGAVAAAMLCPVGSSGTQTELRAAEPSLHLDMDGVHAHHETSEHVHAGSDHHEGHDHGVADKCNMCSAFCSLTPLLTEPPRLPEPMALPSVKFPDLSTPAPSFVSDGQERPPRTI